jgi:hypothetical protein
VEAVQARIDEVDDATHRAQHVEIVGQKLPARVC